MAQLYTNPPYVILYAICIDDSKPNFVPNNWIKNNKLYKVKYIAEALNLEEASAITIVDKNNREIIPSESMSAFRSDRFHFFQIILN